MMQDATVHAVKCLLGPFQFSGLLSSRVEGQMSRLGGQPDVEPSVFSFQARLVFTVLIYRPTELTKG